MARAGDDTLANVNTVSTFRRNTADRRLMAQAIGDRDEGFLMELQSAYTADTIVLAELTPQIQIAWADGAVSRCERAVIEDSAAHRCVRPLSRAGLQLARWLERRPSEAFFRISREAIKRMLRRLPAHLQVNVRRSLFREFSDVARASGGILGWRSVSTEEQQLIDSIHSELEPGDPPEAGRNDSRPAARAVSTGGAEKTSCSNVSHQPGGSD